MSETTAPFDPDRAIGEALAFARAALGPSSELALGSPETQVLLLTRLRQGMSLRDSVLGVVHRVAGRDAAVADEFLGHFLMRLLKLGQVSISPALRAYLDSGDLVQSVLGDAWRDFQALHFESEQQFLSFLAQRLQWKAAQKARKKDFQLRAPRGATAEELGKGSDTRLDPGAQSELQEQKDLLALAILKLPERDKNLLRRYLRGESPEEIERAVGLSRGATRKALQRAMERARSCL